MSKNTGIPTTYAGVNFRSRLEAKWAAFFDLVCWRWTYEPLDYPGWIPDFMLEEPSSFGQAGILIEVKPEHLWDECAAELSGRPMWPAQIPYDIVICGHSPFLHETSSGYPVMGIYSEAIPDEAEWLRGKFDYSAMVQGSRPWRLTPMYAWPGEPRDRQSTLELWRKAGNATQWRAQHGGGQPHE
jgi:hypothetical protein